VNSTKTSKPTLLGAWCARLCLLGAGVLIGHWHADQPAATAETRSTEQRQAFLSGSERSELVLKDIHKTLETMDARLASIEQAAAKAAGAPARTTGLPVKGK
jgi:hypothetical protein